jgi:uncharacterized membrane protein
MKILLFLHVIGGILFLGNIVVTAFWKITSDASQNLHAIYSTTRKALMADYVFTIPGLILILFTGNHMAHQLGYPMNQLSWVFVSNWLFVLTGLIWLFILIPLQFKMVRYSKQSIEMGRISNSYQLVSKYWMIFGVLATLSPLVLYF